MSKILPVLTPTRASTGRFEATWVACWDQASPGSHVVETVCHHSSPRRPCSASSCQQKTSSKIPPVLTVIRPSTGSFEATWPVCWDHASPSGHVVETVCHYFSARRRRFAWNCQETSSNIPPVLTVFRASTGWFEVTQAACWDHASPGGHLVETVCHHSAPRRLCSASSCQQETLSKIPPVLTVIWASTGRFEETWPACWAQASPGSYVVETVCHHC